MPKGSASSLIVAPQGIRDRVIAMIEREAAISSPDNPGRIVMKMNNLSDEAVIDALLALLGPSMERFE